jgi:hypothetical protein
VVIPGQTSRTQLLLKGTWTKFSCFSKMHHSLKYLSSVRITWLHCHFQLTFLWLQGTEECKSDSQWRSGYMVFSDHDATTETLYKTSAFPPYACHFPCPSHLYVCIRIEICYRRNVAMETLLFRHGTAGFTLSIVLSIPCWTCTTHARTERNSLLSVWLMLGRAKWQFRCVLCKLQCVLAGGHCSWILSRHFGAAKATSSLTRDVTIEGKACK